MRLLMLAAVLASLATSATADPIKDKADALAKFLFEKELPENPKLDELFKPGAVRQRRQTVDERVLRRLEPIPAFAKCLLVVEGRTYIDGDCTHEKVAGGAGLYIESESTGFFVYLYGGGSSWNGEPSAKDPSIVVPYRKAHTPLGDLKRDGSCWIGERAKVCINP